MKSVFDYVKISKLEQQSIIKVDLNLKEALHK